MHPFNAIPIKTWIDDKDDNELEELIKLLEYLAGIDNIPKVLSEIKKNKWALNADSVNKIIEIPSVKRENFNSPVNANNKGTFQFDNA